MDNFERIFLLVCLCLGAAMFGMGVWHLIGGVNGLRIMVEHIKDWFR